MVVGLNQRFLNPLNIVFKRKQGYSLAAAKASVFADIDALIKEKGFTIRAIRRQLGKRALSNRDELVAQSVACMYNGDGEKEIARVILGYLKERLR